jgi:hypothetical protein
MDQAAKQFTDGRTLSVKAQRCWRDSQGNRLENHDARLGLILVECCDQKRAAFYVQDLSEHAVFSEGPTRELILDSIVNRSYSSIGKSVRSTAN